MKMLNSEFRILNNCKDLDAIRKAQREYSAFSIQHSEFKRGFTLIEVLISAGIFAVVIIMAVGAMISLKQAQVKAVNIQNVQDNIRFALEFMTKELRTGTDFTIFGCSLSGCTEIRFIRQQGENVGYCLSSGAMLRFISPSTCATGSAVTSSAVVINKLFFNVIGHAIGPSDGQPRITVTIEARSVNLTLRLETNFDLQTTVTSRSRDL